MPKGFEWSRWRSLNDPIAPDDLLQPDSPRYESGKLPAKLVLLLTDASGNRLHGPVRFPTQGIADTFLESNPWVDAYFVVPKP